MEVSARNTSFCEGEIFFCFLFFFSIKALSKHRFSPLCRKASTGSSFSCMGVFLPCCPDPAKVLNQSWKNQAPAASPAHGKNCSFLGTRRWTEIHLLKGTNPIMYWTKAGMLSRDWALSGGSQGGWQPGGFLPWEGVGDTRASKKVEAELRWVW